MTNLEAMTESAKIMRKMAEDHKVDDNKPSFCGSVDILQHGYIQNIVVPVTNYSINSGGI